MEARGQPSQTALAHDPGAWRRYRNWGVSVICMAALGAMALDVGFTPERLMSGMARLGRLLATMFPPDPGGQTVRILKSLAETLAMAFAGTVIAAAIALPFGIAGARTVVRHPAVHFALRRFLDVFRGIPALIWALILLSAFGLGPVAGVMALALADAPSLAKLFAEAIENVDRRPVEGVRAAGASPLQITRLGILPQVAPVMTSQCLYFLEGNFRNAAILGVVGAGGIGFELDERIRIFDFDTASFIIILYMLAVAALDSLSRHLRARLA